MNTRVNAQKTATAAPPAHIAQAPEPSLTSRSFGTLRRKCACGGSGGAGGDECEGCKKKKTLHRWAASPSASAGVPSVVHDVLHSPGRPLDASVRAFMEPRFGHDFSHVRVHADAQAAESARGVNALAYTVGNHIAFAHGRYTPGTQAGRGLLAHELVHTLQDRGSSSLHPSLEVGRSDDPAEHEADRVAGAVIRGSTMPSVSPVHAPAQLRRTPDEPEALRTDLAHLPAPGHGPDARIHVIRTLTACECRKVPDVREGVFYNPDIQALAIAYRHCRGGTTADVYGQVESNVSSFLSGGTPPTGTARIGFEINVVGRNVSGRATLEATGSTVSGSQGVGGRAQVVFQGNSWRVFVTSDFLHRLGAQQGDVLNFNLGARVGSITAEVQISDALSSSPQGTGAACIDIFGGSARLCATLSAGGGTGITPGGELRVPLGGPEVRHEECYQCLCPPPAKHYKCYLDIPPVEHDVQRQMEVEVPGEYRYYFRLDRPTPSEESELRGRSDSNLAAVGREVAAGGHVVTITGYASPEATEAHNQSLSENRARTLAGLVRSRVPAGTTLPEPDGGGELLGRRPSPSPTSHLGDVITANGFRSAEDISVLLLGEEIPRPELADQFVSLFQALPEDADRLALFGLAPGDPLAPRVLTAIQAFLRYPHAGARPWEQVFRLLRVGVVRTSRPEQQTYTETERTSGSLTEIDESECNQHGQEAESSGALPPVPPEFRSPHRGREDRDVECTIEVRPEDRRGGCSYDFPADMRLGARAPSYAPRRLD